MKTTNKFSNKQQQQQTRGLSSSSLIFNAFNNNIQMKKYYTRFLKFFALCAIVLGSLINVAWGQTSISTIGVAVTENFNTLANTNDNNPWTNNSTLSGWYSNQTVYHTKYASGQGGLYAFGDVGNSDRALGSLSSGPTIRFGWRLVNNTGVTINSITISYTGEQWRRGGTNSQAIAFDYKVGASGISDGSGWTSVSDLDFTSPSTTGGSNTDIDGNLQANQNSISYTITGLSIANGQEIWIRWTDVNDAGTEHGLAVDDISVTAFTAKTIRYVTENGAGIGDGSSWTNATYDLQEMINASSAGDQVWVAAGTYKPMYTAANYSLGNEPSTSGGRDNAFVLKAGVKIYGGFDANTPENSVADRAITTESGITIMQHESILSGDIGIPINNTDNCYHVVIGAGNMVSGTDTARLDGFTIEGGNAAPGQDEITVNNVTVQHRRGGGIFNQDAAPILAHLVISNNMATASTAGGIGGGICNRGTSSNAVLTHVIIKNNKAHWGGGIGNHTSSPVLTHVVISNNEANSGGGGMYNLANENIAKPVLEYVTIINNKAKTSGGGISNDGNGNYPNDASKSPVLTHVIISNNTTTGTTPGIDFGGGGIFNGFFSPTLTDVTIDGNMTALSGGGIYNRYSSPVLTNVTISNNKATSTNSNEGGGGIYNYNASPTLTDVIIKGNEASYNGGGIGNVHGSSPLVLTNVIISKNTAKNNGGGISNTHLSTSLKLKNVTIDSNEATVTGGGIYNNMCSPALTDLTIRGNNAKNGGGISNENESSPQLVDVIISKNTATSNGGGMYNYGNNTTPTLTNVTIDSNEAHLGGGIYNESSSPTLTDVTISGNHAQGSDAEGGGIYNNSSSPTLTNVIIRGNKSDDDGGGISNIVSSSPKLFNVLISGNKAQLRGGGMFNSGSQTKPVLTNVTISGNNTTSGSGGIFIDQSVITSLNTIIWGNGSSNIIISNAGEITFTNSLVEEIDLTGVGTGNLDGTNPNNAPQFVDAKDASLVPTIAGDYSLECSSPAINTGKDDANLPATDLAGNSRNVNIVDLGAYEYQTDLTDILAVDMSNQNICNGGSAELQVKGTAPFDIKFQTQKWNGSQWEWVKADESLSGNRKDANIFNRHLEAGDIYDGTAYVESKADGKYKFHLLNIADATGCINWVPKTAEVDVSTTLSAPTVSMDTQAIYNGGSAELKVTGQAPMDIKFQTQKWNTNNNSWEWVKADESLSTNRSEAEIFNRHLEAGDIYNGIAYVESKAAGKYQFNLLSITDATNCTNTTRKTAVVEVYETSAPTVSMDTQIICNGASAELKVTGTPPFDIKFQTQKWNENTNLWEWVKEASPSPNDTVITFNRHLEAGDIYDGIAYVESAADGRYQFNLLSIKDGFGRINTTHKTAVVEVNTTLAPTVSMDTQYIYKGGSAELKVTGQAPMDIKFQTQIDDNGNWKWVKANGELSTNRSEAEIFNRHLEAEDIYNGIACVESEAAGKYQFNLLSITNVHCTNKTRTTSVVEVYETSAPTVSMDTQTICNGASAELKVTGTPPFDIKFQTQKWDNNEWKWVKADNTLSTDRKDAEIFNRHLEAEDIYNGIAYVASAADGKYQFNLLSITDGSNHINKTRKTAVVDVSTTLFAPTVSMADQTICNKASAELIVTGKAPMDIKFQTQKWNENTISWEWVKDASPSPNDTVITFNRHLAEPDIDGGKAYVASAADGKYRFYLMTIKDANDCINRKKDTAEVIVRSSPTVKMEGLSSGSATICKGDSIKLVFTGQQPFTIKFSSTEDGNTEEFYKRDIGTINNEEWITAFRAGTFSFELDSLIDGDGCLVDLTDNANTLTATVNVNPLPTVSMDQSQPICMGDSVAIKVTGTPPYDIKFKTQRNGVWVNSSDGLEANAEIFNRHLEGTDIKDGKAYIASADTGTYTFTFVSIQDANCINDTSKITAEVRVNPRPRVSMASLQTVCKGDSAEISLSGTPPYEIQFKTKKNDEWVINDEGETSSTAGKAGAYIFRRNLAATDVVDGKAKIETADTGTYEFYLVSIQDNNCFNDTLEATGKVRVNPRPTVSMEDQEICKGENATISLTGTAPYEIKFKTQRNGVWVGGTDEASAIEFRRNLTSAEVIGGKAFIPSEDTGTYVFHLVSIEDANCLNTITTSTTAKVRVNALPTVSMRDTTLCVGGSAKVYLTGKAPFTIDFETLYNDGLETNDTLSGTFSRNVTAVDLQTDVDGDYVLIASEYIGKFAFTLKGLTDDNGCSAVIDPMHPVTATVKVNPLPTVTISADTAICKGGTLAIHFTGTPPYTLDYTVDGAAASSIGLTSPLTVYTTNDTAIEINTAGTHTIEVTNLVDGNGCSYDAANSTATANVFVSYPTVTIKNETLCAGDSIPVAFTGKAPFELEYEINGLAPSEYGLANTLKVYQNDTVIFLTVAGKIAKGTFAFTFKNLKDDLGCIADNNSLTQTPVVIINTRPTVTMLGVADGGSNIICLGTSKVLEVSGGEFPYTLTYWDNRWDTSTITLTGQYTPIPSQEAGHFEFRLISLTDNKGCAVDTNDHNSNTVTAFVYVNPIPTVSMPSAPVCKNDSITINFIGTPPFTLGYTVAKDGVVQSPGVYQLPIKFGNGTDEYSITQTGDTSYTAKIKAGEAGDFTFVLNTIQDKYCSNNNITDNTVNITVNELPTVKMDEINPDGSDTICFGESKDLVFTGK
ncbi:MAG: hypothetical protein LBG80_01815, partial [Bacteroidales bacterium]|nr:hypothetical protein [Bacteroidales bacterium]